ncbi:hypothetical protein AGMMS50256_16220 [Betaproteobacteria bacterium]|nr:hypothetical protein AGMMS50256_16220 [Betaproteobacteria bacterium]
MSHAPSRDTEEGGTYTSESVDIRALNAEIARIVTRQAQLRTQIDAIVADLEGEDA